MVAVIVAWHIWILHVYLIHILTKMANLLNSSKKDLEGDEQGYSSTFKMYSSHLFDERG